MRMNRWNWKRRHDRAGEAGQTTVFFVLILGIFLLGALCLAFDLANMWFHRQAAQTAADAACTAGAMDLLVDAEGEGTTHQGFTLGTPYSCTTASTDSVCQYAAKNGYNSNNAAPGNLVSVSFPAGVNGVTTPPAGLAPTPFIRVDVLEHVGTFFVGLLSGGTTADVRAFATCGVEQAAAPIPLIVLNPTVTKALTVQGNSSAAPGCDALHNSKLCIWGGPQQSIQVDSSDTNAAYIGGSAKIDLYQGGPNNTGSDLGTWGGPFPPQSGFIGGSTGNWIAPHIPIGDPFASLAVPTSAITPGAPTHITGGPISSPIVCPDTECAEYAPGIYPSGICVKTGGPAPCTCYPGGGGAGARCVAIFDPGVYIIQGNFSVDDNTCLRPSGAQGDTFNGSSVGGVILYFTNGGTVDVHANAGTGCVAPFNMAGYPGTNSLLTGIKCKSTSTIPLNLQSIATLTGNVLLAPCTGTYGDPYEATGGTDPDGEQRGFLMFQDRTTPSANQSWGGGGSMLLAGTMYFHNSGNFSDSFTLKGSSGSSTYVLGDIVADTVLLTGDSQVTMDLNTSVVFDILRASLFQ